MAQEKSEKVTIDPELIDFAYGMFSSIALLATKNGKETYSDFLSKNADQLKGTGLGDQLDEEWLAVQDLNEAQLKKHIRERCRLLLSPLGLTMDQEDLLIKKLAVRYPVLKPYLPS
jgi:hypothetical protein